MGPPVFLNAKREEGGKKEHRRHESSRPLGGGHADEISHNGELKKIRK